MTIVFEQSWQRSLDVWCEKIAQHYRPTDEISVWLFDDENSRRQAEKRMAVQGFCVRFHAALKPLVHFFRDLDDARAIQQVHIAYPVSPHAVENRFKLEAYPLAALLDQVTFTPKTDDTRLAYDVTLARVDGSLETHQVFCPNRLTTDWGGLPALTPCGWLCVVRDGVVIADHAIQTELVQLFNATMAAISRLPLPANPPWFEELRIDVSLPFQEIPLGYGYEVLSYQEALHEEFYFSLLEYFQANNGLNSGDRSLQPGQIAPFIRFDPQADCRVRVTMQPLCRTDASLACVSVHEAANPLSHAQVHTALEAVGGEAFSVTSRAGRAVRAHYISGSDHAVCISACQHGNETTGTVGALQAALALKQQAGAHFVISPLENPDGNALFLRLLQDNPQHMHHAARYTAYGNDLQSTPDHAPAEREIRVIAQRKSQATLHLNLHGYPSHEWIRPLSGYIPRNFAMWTLPKGFFLLFRYQAGFETLAQQLAQQVTGALSTLATLMQLNQAQVDLYRQHAGQLEFDLINGLPCSFACKEDASFTVEMVTEFPDETISGAAFQLGANVQKMAVLAAYQAWQTLFASHAG